MNQSNPPSPTWRGQQFSVSHADESEFQTQGLRSFFQYRPLGVRTATNGQFGAHVIRAIPGRHAEGEWHRHELDFQMVYVTRGWVRFEYEGHGEQLLHAGSCVVQPAGIRHREIQHSDDLELIEITSPADFDTQPA